MDQLFCSALVTGYERMAAWSDLLDQINVFPVADADTGRNLKISLAPLRRMAEDPRNVPLHLIRAATGNSGNIAAAFFLELMAVEQSELLFAAVRAGWQKAVRAVADPKPGTMLTFFETLAGALPAQACAPAAWDLPAIVAILRQSVEATSDALPELKQAAVVDAGALGMFIFMEAFLSCLAGQSDHSRPITDFFNGKLRIEPGWQPSAAPEDYCVSTLIQPRHARQEALSQLGEWGHSIVVTDDAQQLKIHLHTDNRERLRSGLERIGTVMSWTDERIAHLSARADTAANVHIMTDAAGSLSLDDARSLGFTLLNSYLVVGDQSYPETLYPPEKLYAAMTGGTRVSTAQASLYERRQCYLSAASRYAKVLYLCVGSVYTGNYETASAWQASDDPQQRLTVIDTGAASGRLGIIALATARFALGGAQFEQVLQFARRAVAQSDELVFLDQLKFLAAGGRISKTKGFFGDLLHKKPIITPTAHGAARVAVVRHRAEQLAFALQHLKRKFQPADAPLLLMQYTNNRAWVEEDVARRIRSLLPRAEIIFRPLSLTSGAHMGPGTWAMAILPAAF